MALNPSFNKGDHVYFYLTDNGNMEAYDGQFQDKDEIGDRYRIAVTGDENGCDCIYLVPSGNVFFTTDELYDACESYCRELAFYWNNRADAFYELWLQGNKEENNGTEASIR